MSLILKSKGFAKSSDGTPIYYEVRGEGPPVVLCYGIACLMNHWHHQVKYFSPGHQVIMLDYRGHHQSPIPEVHDNLNLDACVEDIRAVCDHLDIKVASFWGHSWGAQLLIRFFDLYPERVKNFVFVNGFASNPLDSFFGTNIPHSLFNVIRGTHGVLPETANYLWKKLTYNPFAIKATQVLGGFNPHLTAVNDIEIYLKGVAAINIKVFIKLLEALMAYDGRAVCDRIDKPMLIIGGERDFVTPIKFQEDIHKRVKGSEFTRVPFGSHCTMLDMPEFVNIRIEKFLKDQV